MPDWDPILALMDERLVGGFMWMFEAQLEDGTLVHAYKNRLTRHYLFLDESGRAYRWEGDRGYREDAVRAMIEEAFDRMKSPFWEKEDRELYFATLQEVRARA